MCGRGSNSELGILNFVWCRSLASAEGFLWTPPWHMDCLWDPSLAYGLSVGSRWKELVGYLRRRPLNRLPYVTQ